VSILDAFAGLHHVYMACLSRRQVPVNDSTVFEYPASDFVFTRSDEFVHIDAEIDDTRIVIETVFLEVTSKVDHFVETFRYALHRCSSIIGGHKKTMSFHARTSKTTDAVKTTALSISNIVIVGSLLTLSLLEPHDPPPDLGEFVRYELRRVLTTREAAAVMNKLVDDDAVIAREITVDPGLAYSTTSSLVQSVSTWLVKTLSSRELVEFLETLYTAGVASDPSLCVALKFSRKRFNPACPRGVDALEHIIVQLDDVLDIDPGANIDVVIDMFSDVMNELAGAARRSSS